MSLIAEAALANAAAAEAAADGAVARASPPSLLNKKASCSEPSLAKDFEEFSSIADSITV